MLLIGKLKSKQIDAEELSRLKRLLSETGTAKELLADMQQAFSDLELREDKLPGFSRQDQVKAQLLSKLQAGTRSSGKWRRLWPAVAIAASVLLVAGFLMLYKKQEPAPPAIVWQTVETKHGEHKRVILGDGSSILLNGNSRLQYPAGNLKYIRIVKLDGEGFFEVAKDAARPFYVAASDFVTRVVGTSFNIDSKIEKTIEVNTGKVNVFSLSAMQFQSCLANMQANQQRFQQQIEQISFNKAVLEKGQKARLTGNAWTVFRFNTKNWHDNELVYLNEPLWQVAEKAYRFYGDSIYVSPRLSSAQITITFRNKNVEQVVKTLSEITNSKLIKDKKDNIWKILNK
ncbi:FecR family protein [Niabella drilacis]|uniref:FecR family protein n=1 Tax=Niabella drilacis (strain DSM 25811 / CCM 8410 / CCUG 62505 / LMG 26954 / E90) TaxID=1285928 RepID=A0A1G6T7Y1_NIADE|nr:FecR family protein [Niabella drilacis]